VVTVVSIHRHATDFVIPLSSVSKKYRRATTTTIDLLQKPTRSSHDLFGCNDDRVARCHIVYNTTTTTATTTMKEVYPAEMSERERYLFDLNGYIVIPNVLTPDEVTAANAAIDRHLHQAVERADPALRNAVPGTPLYGNGPGRQDLGRVLEWGKTDSRVFKSILAHPRLLPLYHGLLGSGYHMDHLPFVIMQQHGAEGFQLHGGTIDCGTGEYNPHLAYTCHHDTIRCSLLGVNVMLTDHQAGDGGFCVVPGSHKSNFKMPAGLMDGLNDDDLTPWIRQPTTRAGDVVLFSEGTVHGALPWTPTDRTRLACLYRFAPATNVYGRSYFGHSAAGAGTAAGDDDDGTTTNLMGWPSALYDDLTDAQRAVLEPPYANRLDRPNIQPDDDGSLSVVITTRSERKKQHDRQVFGTLQTLSLGSGVEEKYHLLFYFGSCLTRSLNIALVVSLLVRNEVFLVRKRQRTTTAAAATIRHFP
jgi:ectoine hydroxylase-related dioxygenase (phytanoyl-CoA dioxygenase family)